MKIATQLTDEQVQKLAFIQQKTQQNSDEVLGAALDYYYRKLLTTSTSHIENFSKIGFVGCIEAEPDLAENCESILMQEINTEQ
ncbi:MAG: hypothetical protein P5702_06245 [Limnospira sp. PMC 1291.21]|uniref:CopG family transcriptional regulator n=2 Tax=Limnospira TaxID=2596745 RepID=A0ABU9EI69_LIMFS|nr:MULTISPECIES: hypothetical protein [Limnospira]EKD07534.1 hypothetical protein SPLC1_S412010 [Arthrospira platensis C1]MDC0837800.1 hypothetical protein [Limnoraphis robusta]MDY7051900.1 hypothetical protein [Limnospira fusiformis LS22]QJB25842.1 hypothetical protein HFV01_08565 [Limnospira fusiformis SAG 85.79]RAQ44878.1 hypothetical protein B9S53_08400 [Arthrospira sp. O9.13F]